jgi:hypothetical protein
MLLIASKLYFTVLIYKTLYTPAVNLQFMFDTYVIKGLCVLYIYGGLINAVFCFFVGIV